MDTKKKLKIYNSVYIFFYTLAFTTKHTEMKKIHVLLYLSIIFTASAYGQRQVEYTVRLNHLLLDTAAINDFGKRAGTLSDFLNAQGRETAARLSGPIDFSQLQVQKLFPHHRTVDTISISRQGSIVYIPPFWATFRIAVPENRKEQDFVNAVKAAAPLVVYIDPPLRAILYDYPTDSLYLEQKSLFDTTDYEGGINVASAWDLETGKRHIKVGVFDTGIDSTHEDIRLLTGFNYFEDVMYDGSTNWGSADVRGHGTAVAGIIGARRNNVTGIAGIAGGDGNDTSGVSLIDFKCLPGFYEGYAYADFISVGMIDAARAVGTYYDWNSTSSWFGTDVDEYFKEHVPGYGVHINNHSYGLTLARPPGGEGHRDLPSGDSITWEPTVYLPECHLCLEAYLFSLRNGVVNVISRGNGFDFSAEYDAAVENIPQRLDDSWVISVGASGTDGERLYGPSGNVAVGENWYSPLGLNLDLLAPGTKANVATLRSPSKLPLNDELRYINFNGTSASAPHVSGVVALMLSHYNKPCYSNQNLDPADVEYILQRSAMDLDQPGYDDYSGWGRLNARKALEMIQYPEYQIVHPQSPPTQVELLAQDTIHLFVDDPLYSQAGGPLSQGFGQNFLEKPHKVERLKYRLTYNFLEYLVPPLSSESAELLDVWLRHSQTTSLGYHADTLMDDVFLDFMDTFRIEPRAEIISWDAESGEIVLEGYYYHFIGVYAPDIYGIYQQEDFWFPLNPQLVPPRMAYSIYLHDAEAHGIDFPCDSLNILVDLYVGAEHLDLDQAVHLFPNPGKEGLVITWEGETDFARVELLDALGRKCAVQDLHQQKNTYLGTAHLEAGTYFVVLHTEDRRTVTKKWIKL